MFVRWRLVKKSSRNDQSITPVWRMLMLGTIVGMERRRLAWHRCGDGRMERWQLSGTVAGMEGQAPAVLRHRCGDGGMERPAARRHL